MKSKVVQISYTEDEYNYIRQKANEAGLTMSMFIKKKTLPRREYDESYEKMLELINNLETGEIFTLRKLFNKSWEKISRGTRLSLGRNLFRSVDEGIIRNIELLSEKDLTQSLQYRKL